MEMTERPVGDVTVLELSGKLALGDATQNLHDKINSLLHQDRKLLVLNLSKLSSVDSAGLGELVRTHSTTHMKGGRVCIAGLPKRIQGLLAMTKLLTVFDVHDDEASAIEHLGA